LTEVNPKYSYDRNNPDANLESCRRLVKTRHLRWVWRNEFKASRWVWGVKRGRFRQLKHNMQNRKWKWKREYKPGHEESFRSHWQLYFDANKEPLKDVNKEVIRLNFYLKNTMDLINSCPKWVGIRKPVDRENLWEASAIIQVRDDDGPN
jgi:hypothetical protein